MDGHRRGLLLARPVLASSSAPGGSVLQVLPSQSAARSPSSSQATPALAALQPAQPDTLRQAAASCSRCRHLL